MTARPKLDFPAWMAGYQAGYQDGREDPPLTKAIRTAEALQPIAPPADEIPPQMAKFDRWLWDAVIFVTGFGGAVLLMLAVQP